MVDLRGEVDLRWLERVVSGEVDREEKHTARVWRVWWAHDGCLPVVQVVADWAGRAGRGWVSKLLV